MCARYRDLDRLHHSSSYSNVVIRTMGSVLGGIREGFHGGVHAGFTLSRVSAGFDSLEVQASAVITCHLS